MDNIKRISEKDYIPTEQDIVRNRVKTTGISEMSFKINDKVLKFTDVGGQRNERKKWIHCFEGVTGIIFLTSLSEYDQKCYEDDETNRMKESLLLFDEIVNSRWFVDTPIVLFLNKTDIFQEKLKKNDLSIAFKDYENGSDYQKSFEFISKKYTGRCRNIDKKIHVFGTCATDKEQLSKIFESVTNLFTK
eukprot:gene10510-3032_t